MSEYKWGTMGWAWNDSDPETVYPGIYVGIQEKSWLKHRVIIEGNFEYSLFGNFSTKHPLGPKRLKKRLKWVPYPEGEMPDLYGACLYRKHEPTTKVMVTGYDKESVIQLLVEGIWYLNKEVFEKYRDENGKPIGKQVEK